MRGDIDIVIVGGGVVGLTVAALLARGGRDGLRITVVDGGVAPDYSADRDLALRVSAISSGSVDVLGDASAWDRIPPDRLGMFDEMRVWDASLEPNSPETLSFAAADFALPALGYITENDAIRHALIESLRRTDVGLEFGTRIDAVMRRGERLVVRLEDGRELTPELLVGADGGDSFVRRRVAIDVRTWRYPQAAFVTHLDTEKPHRSVAWQRFLPDSTIALLPLHDGRVSTVWSTEPDAARAAVEQDDAELGEHLSELSDYVLGALSPAGPRATFPLTARHAKGYVRPGVALIGDAAHSVHPLAGQGLNLGIADAAALAETVLAAAANGEAVGDYRVLRRYERARKGANLAMLGVTDGLYRLFGLPSPLIARLRTTGMRAFNASGPVRTLAMRVALGL